MVVCGSPNLLSCAAWRVCEDYRLALVLFPEDRRLALAFARVTAYVALRTPALGQIVKGNDLCGVEMRSAGLYASPRLQSRLVRRSLERHRVSSSTKVNNAI